MPLAFDHERDPHGSRFVAIRIAQATLRLMENWRRHVRDYDSAMILLGVGVITAEKLTRTGSNPDLEDLSQPLPPGVLGKCNLASLAAATGLNRETVRRKVNQLLQAGLLVRIDGSLALNPKVSRSSGMIDLVWNQLEAIRRVANDLVRDGALRLRDAQPKGNPEGR